MGAANTKAEDAKLAHEKNQKRIVEGTENGKIFYTRGGKSIKDAKAVKKSKDARNKAANDKAKKSGSSSSGSSSQAGGSSTPAASSPGAGTG